MTENIHKKKVVPRPTSFQNYITSNPLNWFKKIIVVMSGKGGVGKSTVSANLAMTLQEMGHKVGIMDADLVGPSIPRLLGIEKEAMMMTKTGLEPVSLENGLKVVSINLMMDKEDKPLIWRGPLITNTIKQFYTDIIWGELDYLVIDLPPGTSDVSMTIMQAIPVDGIVMVAIPQDMVSMIVSKAVGMAKNLNVPVLGIVENMSYVSCTHCDEKIYMYEAKELDEFLEKRNLEVLLELPMKPNFSTVYQRDEELREQFKALADKVITKLETKPEAAE
ncbi:MAG: Mrp/NBP35 family ATP-binding protein [Eubacteriales bacterium]|nr:Mrp/NBP35 family ATP-binding protein [Eubacteriales bacterium]